MRRRTIARTAVIGGAAYYAAKRGAQAGREEQPPADAVEEAPAAQAAGDPMEQLKELHELREQGILTEEEFAAEKKKLLAT